MVAFKNDIWKAKPSHYKKPVNELVASFELNNKLIRYQAVRLILTVIIAACVFLGVANRGGWDGFFSNTLLVVIAFVSAFLGLILWYKKIMKKRLKIVVNKESVVLPRFYFWTGEIFSKTIFSLEDLKWKGELAYLLIGRLDGSTIFIAKEKFCREADFLRFRGLLLDIVQRNNFEAQHNKAIYIRGKASYQLLVQFAFAALWLLLFAYLRLPESGSLESLLEQGALTKTVLDGGEFYRAFSTFFLHSDIFHVLLNLLVFALISESLLRLVDVYRYLSLLFISAFLAVAVSFYLSPHEYVIGASGGVFGLFGAYCAIKFTKYLPGTVSQRSNLGLVLVIVLEIIGETFSRGIDSYSHVAGFLTGVLCMSAYLYFAKSNSIYRSSNIEKGGAVLLSGAYLWGLFSFLLRV